jgi:hypothetical protein
MNQRMESFINNMFSTISSQYPSLNIYAYDVVNEAMTDNGASANWKGSARQAGLGSGANGQSAWVSVYGDNGFIQAAFSYAKAARDKYLPNMKLFYNDYNEYIGGKRAAIAAMAKEMKAYGLDGIGMQSHLDVGYPSFQEYSSTLDEFLSIAEVQITELDITGSNTSGINTYYKQIFQKAYNVRKEGANFTALVVWGTTNGSSWRSSQGNDLLLFNNQGQGNGNYSAVSGSSIVPQSEWGDGDSAGGGPIVVTPVEPDENGRFFYDTFESDIGDWAGRGGTDTTATASSTAKFEGSKSLYVTGRTATWMGTSRSLSTRAFEPGGTYSFGGAVMAEVDTNWQMSVYYSLDGEDHYDTIATASSVAGEWAVLEDKFTIPTGASGLLFYFETEYFEEEGAGNLTNFYLDEVYGGTENAKSPFENYTPPTTTVATTTTARTTAPTTSRTTAPTTSRTTAPTTIRTTVSTTVRTTTPTTKAPEDTDEADPTTTTKVTTSKTTSKTTAKTTTQKPPTTTRKPPVDTDPEVEYGDFTGNGKITISDYVAMFKHISGGQNDYVESADCYYDGKNDILDCLIIIRYLLGYEPSLPVSAE